MKLQNAEVHFDRVLGKIKPMHAVNNGPVADDAIPGIPSNAKYFTEAGFPCVRNHDAALFRPYGEKVFDRKALTYDLNEGNLIESDEHDPVEIVDVHRIFPDFDADENDPKSYRFAATDAHVALTLSTGTNLLYRLGAAIEHGPKYGTYPPKDFHKWARICEHIIRHYTEGWADGLYYTVAYWEIWNEPDCGPVGNNPCWQGTYEQFIDFFEITVKYLKEKFPHQKIGGPALCTSPKKEYYPRLFAAIRDRHIPIDFFSFHWYGNVLAEFVGIIRQVRELCGQYGFGDMELILNEYNFIVGFDDQHFPETVVKESNEIGAAFVTSCMLLAQREPLDMLMYYDARPSLMCGLFSLENLTPMRLFYAMKMFHRLYTLGTETEITGLPAGICAVAAKGADGAAVLLSYYSDDKNSTEKEFSLFADGKTLWRTVAVDAEHFGEEISVDPMHIIMPPNSVLLLEFR